MLFTFCPFFMFFSCLMPPFSASPLSHSRYAADFRCHVTLPLFTCHAPCRHGRYRRYYIRRMRLPSSEVSPYGVFLPTPACRADAARRRCQRVIGRCRRHYRRYLFALQHTRVCHATLLVSYAIRHAPLIFMSRHAVVIHAVIAAAHRCLMLARLMPWRYSATDVACSFDWYGIDIHAAA